MDPLTTMALGAASWLVRTMINSLASNLLEAWAIRQHLGDGVAALKSELRLVHAVLCNAEGRATNSTPFLEMLQELHDAAHDADCLLDELEYFRLRDVVKGTQDAADAVKESFFHRAFSAAGDALKLTARQYCCACASGAKSPPKHNVADSKAEDSLHCLEFDRLEMGRRLKNVTSVLESRRGDVHSVLLTVPLVVPSTQETARSHRIATTAFQSPFERKVFGLNELRNHVVGLLSGSERLSEALTVLPIVGQDGIGKTTFARYVFNDERLDDSVFQDKIWVCASMGKLDIPKLTQEILDQLQVEEAGNAGAKTTSLMHLQNLIVKRLSRKNSRVLIVLDDLWECTQLEWDSLIAPLYQTQVKGNAIIVTTRMPAIANMVTTKDSKPLEFQELHPDFFWQYFMFCIFGDEIYVFRDSRMREIAEKLLAKLKGNPLAAKTIGRLLASNVDIMHWREVFEKPLWTRGVQDNDIMPVLRISYEYLNFPISRCFLYSGLFPEEYEFEEDMLVQFWLCQGCITSGDETEPLEEIGHQYLNTLVAHGFFEKKYVHHGRVAYFLHDFLHQLARIMSSSECHIVDGLMTRAVPPSIRHVSILTKSVYRRNEYQIVERNESFETRLLELKQKLTIGNLSTLMLIGDCDPHLVSTFMAVFQEANGIRVLHISVGSSIGNSLSCLFSKLIHLRYLSLEASDMQNRLPSYLTAYYHLKVLQTNAEPGCLPGSMCDLINLRHFMASEDLHAEIGNVGKLVHLQQLRKFKVGTDSAFKLGQLGNMKELGGSLSISSLQNAEVVEEKNEAKLEEKRIQILSLKWDRSISKDEHIQREIIESLRPNENIRELCIDSYEGTTFPRWLGEREHYECLESMSFKYCVAWKTVPPVEVLYFLKKLELVGLELVKKLEFGVQKSNISVDARPLEELVITNMQELVLIDMNQMFPDLKSVCIEECPRLLKVPFFNSLVEGEKFQWIYQLQRITIINCNQLQTAVPPLPHMPSLRSWHVSNVGSLPYASSECDMKSLSLSGSKEVEAIDANMFAFHQLSEIKNLEIKWCPNLKKWYGLHLLSSLERLSFLHCWSNSASELSFYESQESCVLPCSIKSLHFFSCEVTDEAMTSLLGQLPNLTELRLEFCSQVHFLSCEESVLFSRNETSHMNAAASENSPKANTLYIPSHLFSSLRVLSFTVCSEVMMDREDIFAHFASLQNLCIAGCPKFFLSYNVMLTLPSALQFLELDYLPLLDGQMNLLSRVSQLRELCLRGCSFTPSAMEGLHSLPYLATLAVYSCNGFAASWKSSAIVAEGSMLPLQTLSTDDPNVLTPAICGQLSSLHCLSISGYDQQLEMFSEEQEEALLLLSSLKNLDFDGFTYLRSLLASFTASVH